MTDARAWAWFGAGLAGALGAIGVYRWRTRRAPGNTRSRSAPDKFGASVIRTGAERLVDTLPRPDLAPLRVVTRRNKVAPGTLVVLPLDPDEAVVYEPEDRYALALRLPDGRGFMFTFQHLLDPTVDDLRDPDRLWEWDDTGDPDDEAVELARGLGWADIADVLDIDPAEIERSVRYD